MFRTPKNQGDRPKVRPATAAGRFYPSDPVELRSLIEALLAAAPPAAGPVPKAIIVPHAGYPYSGPIAASGYARLVPARKVIKRIILLGPSHFVPLEGLALSSTEAFATPLGSVPVDPEGVRQARSLPQVSIVDLAHQQEHALEVQLPFLQVVLNQFTIVPLAVGEASTEQVAQVVDALWGGPETRLVISSDLSHYHDQFTAQQLDRITAGVIEALEPEALQETQACGRVPICGLLRAARQHGLQARAIDLRTSGDTAGPRHQVVGYGAFVFQEPGN